MSDARIAVRSLRVLRRHNVHAFVPVIEAVMAIGSFEEIASSDVPGFAERLTSWLPGLGQHACSVGRPGGFLQRLRRGTYFPHICEHVAIELQNRMGFDVAFGRSRGTGEIGVYRVVIEYLEADPALAAFDAAQRLTLAAFDGAEVDIAAELERLRGIADVHRFGPSTRAIVDAARARGIPVLRLTPRSGLVQLGYGAHQRRIRASQTAFTSSIAVDICQEKPLTNRLLHAIGVQVPAGACVDDADQAWAVAQELGLPVVVKPQDGSQGKGVSVDLRDEDAVRRAWEAASRFGDVLVERFIRGGDHRLLVVDGRMVAAARREPAQVVGDGARTVADLVAEANRDPRRRPGHSAELSPIVLDEEASLVLAAQGLTRDDVPGAGRAVLLRRNGNLSTGGTATDVTDLVHPDNARLAELAAQFLQLDVAGIDVVCEDIARPLAEQGGAIVEVNAAPGLRMHLHPTVGTPRDVGRPIVDMLFPASEAGRLPLVAVTGTNGKTTVVRLIAHLHATAHRVVGMTCTDGIYIAGERIVAGDCAGPRSAETVLMHPRVEVAVLECARGGILREGLGFEACSVGVVTNISADHLGIGGIERVEDLARVKQVVVQAVAPGGAAVLNADDPLVAEMAAATEAEVVYTSTRADNPVALAHAATGGCCVLVEDGRIVLVQGGSRQELVELARVPFTHGGAVAFEVANALSAVAAAWVGGVNPALIVRGLTTFTTDAAVVPGRFNVLQLRGCEVLVDYAHNVAAMRALGQAVATRDRRRTVLVTGLPGDRRDEDLVATIAAAADFVDVFVLHDLAERRGRAQGEVPALVAARGARGREVRLAERAVDALKAAWELLRPGDRLIVIPDDVDETLDLLARSGGGHEEDEGCVAAVGGVRPRPVQEPQPSRMPRARGRSGRDGA